MDSVRPSEGEWLRGKSVLNYRTGVLQLLLILSSCCHGITESWNEYLKLEGAREDHILVFPFAHRTNLVARLVVMLVALTELHSCKVRRNFDFTS